MSEEMPAAPAEPPRSGPPALVNALVVALLAVAALAHAWGLDRGFDMHDEGAWLQAYTRPGGPPTEATLAPRMLALTLGHGREGRPLTVPAWRTANAQLLVAGTLVLVIGFRRWLRACDPSLAAHAGRAPVFALALLGTYAGTYGWPRSPGVESVSGAFGAGALGLALAAAAPPSGHVLPAAGAGAALALAALARPESGAALALVLGLLLSTAGRRPLLAALAGAVAAAVTALALLAPDPGRWIDDLRWAARLPAGLVGPTWGETSGNLLAAALTPYLTAFVAAHLIARASAAVRAGRTEGLPNLRLRRWAAGLLVLGVIAQARWISDLFGILAGWQVYVTGAPRPVTGRDTHAYVVLAGLALAVAGAGRRLTTGPHEDALIAGGLALAAAPLAMSLGVPEALDVRARAHLAPWLILIALACGSARRNVSAPASSLVLVATAAVACLQFTVNHHYTPQPLSEQVQASALTRAAGLRLDPGAAAFLAAARELAVAAGHRPGGPLLAFHDLPGLTYLLDGTAPGDGLFRAGQGARNAAVIEKSAVPLAGAVVATTGALDPAELAALAKAGVDFNTYKPLGSLSSPHAVTFWAQTKK